MSWLQLELETNQAKAEELSELLEQFGAVSVSFTASSNEPLFDTQGQGEDDNNKLWQKTRVIALLHLDTDLDIMLVCLRDRIGADNIYQHKIELLKDKDWVGEFKAQHEPLFFSERVCISPSWCDRPENNIPTLILDPGLAFGTGAHPTTSLCIEWLAENDLGDKVVIDYGCGSGILAMVAALLGAKKVYAVDIDQQALEAARENINRNDLAEKIVVGHVDDCDLPVTDILVANILMNPLKGLVEKFSGLTKHGGNIILSGLLHVQAEECLAAYASCFNMDEPVFNSEWTRLHGIRI
jgi:ribosomal protein L11 methyltransferase